MTSDAFAPRHDALTVVGCIGIATAFAWLLRDIRNDDAYITYRYAQNLLAGHGLVFNHGEAVLATTAPGHALLVALGGLLWSDLVDVALVWSWLATVLLAWSCHAVLRGAGSRSAAIIAAGAVLFSPSTYDLYPLETVIVGALVFAGLRFAQRANPVTLGVLAGLAVTIRADAIIAFVAIGVAAWTHVDWTTRARTLGAALIVALPWPVYATLHYGSPFPSTSSTKTGWQGHGTTYVGKLWERGIVPLLGVESATLLVVPIALIGVVAIIGDRRYALVRALVLWAVLHTLAYSALRILWPHHWYYSPITLTFAVCLGIGGATVGAWILESPRVRVGHPKLLRGGLAAVVVSMWASGTVEILALRDRIATEFFLGGRDALYRDAAAWFGAHSRPQDRIALAEPGTVAFYSDRPVVDMMGLVTPAIGVAMKQRRALVDVPWVVEHFDPEFFLLIPPKPDASPPRLPGAPQYVQAASFDRAGVDRRVVVYARPPSL